MSRFSRRGDSLVELIVALVILEIVGAAALAGALTIEHLNARATHGTVTDEERWRAYRAAEVAGDCVSAAAPDSIPLVFPPTSERPLLPVAVRCGR